MLSAFREQRRPLSDITVDCEFCVGFACIPRSPLTRLRMETNGGDGLCTWPERGAAPMRHTAVHQALFWSRVPTADHISKPCRPSGFDQSEPRVARQ